MPKYQVKYRSNPMKPSYTTKEVEAEAIEKTDEWVTFSDSSGIVWQVDAKLVAEIERDE